MSTPTPGPWSIRETPKAIANSKWREVVGADLTVIGELFCDHDLYPAEPTSKEAEANARLIAAAPEMLDAGSAVLAEFDALVPLIVDRGAQAEMAEKADKLRAAIAKATGGQR